MKYIWIIITVIIEIFGWIGVVYDIWDTYQYNKYIDNPDFCRNLDEFTYGFIATHIIILFIISFIMWCAS